MPTAYRTLITGVATAALLAAAVGPAAATTTTTEEARGTSVLQAVPLHVEALSTPVDVGTATMMATTDADTLEKAPFASLGLTLLDVAGAKFGELTVASDGDTSNEGTSVDETTPAGAISATAGNILALADDNTGSATAALTTLTTEATVLSSLGLEATLTDAVTSVDDAAAAGALGVALAGIDLDLESILGTDLLAQLPLDDLLALADGLSVPTVVSTDDVDAFVTATETLVDDVADVVTASDAVDTAADDLLTAATNVPADLANAITAIKNVDPGSLDLAGDLTTALASFSGDATTCALAIPLTPDATFIASVLACLSDLAFGTEFAALQNAVTDYLTAVTDVVSSAGALDETTLDGLLDGVLDLIDDLAALELGALSPIEITQQTRAVGDSLDDSSASHTCSLTTISALGGTPLEIADCDTGDGDALALVVNEVTGALDTVFETIGGVDAGAGIELSLFGTVADSVTQDADGFVRATSQMEILRLVVPDLTVTPCDVEVVGQVVCALGTDLLGPLTDALGDLGAAQTVVEDAITSVADPLSDLGETLDATAGTDAADAVDAVVTALTTLLDGLDLGDLGTGGGLTIPGVELVVDPTLESEHLVTTATVESPGPADPAPADPEDTPTLPNTGGGAALLAVLAMGAGAWLWRRREAA